MCCGTTQNSYKTLSSLTFMLPSGTTIDSSREDAETAFATAEPQLVAGLLDIKRAIESDPELIQRIRRKFSIKNTPGYHIEAFLDGETPLANLPAADRRGGRTLAFMIFPDMYAACAAVKPFVDLGAAAVELTDRTIGTISGISGANG
jgi:D-lactate dehydrogenase